MAPKIEMISEIPSLHLGEAPHWDQDTQSLYFVDILGQTVHKWVPSTKKHTKAKIGAPVSFIIPVKGKKDQFVIGKQTKIVIIEWDGTSDAVKIVKTVGEVDRGTENRVNDGKCDSSGKLWTGTMGPEKAPGQFTLEKGSLFSINGTTNEIKSHLSKIGVSNGLAWNQASDKMYYIDSVKGTVDGFDFDVDESTISNQMKIFTARKHGFEGVLDGMTIDANGHLWVAVFSDGVLLQIDPKKPETLLKTVTLPVKQVSSCTFGGRNLDELYVTTARLALEGVVLEPPENGAVYKISDLGVKGLSSVDFEV